MAVAVLATNARIVVWKQVAAVILRSRDDGGFLTPARGHGQKSRRGDIVATPLAAELQPRRAVSRHTVK
jgi:hypothetical protein